MSDPLDYNRARYEYAMLLRERGETYALIGKRLGISGVRARYLIRVMQRVRANNIWTGSGLFPPNPRPEG